MIARVERRALLVLGMHRSGTSALARVVNLLGWRSANDLLGTGKGNPAGHWEPRRVVEINNQLLNALDRPWADPKPMPTGWERDAGAKAALNTATSFIKAEFDDGESFSLKDPRLCRLLPIWLEALTFLGIQPVCLMCIRNPLEVSESLIARDGIGLQHALLLWKTYALEAEYHSRDVHRAFVSYDGMLEDWRATLAAAFDDLLIPANNWSKAAQLEVDNFLVKDQRHFEKSLGELLNATPHEHLAEMYTTLCAKRDGAIADVFDREREEWRSTWANMSPGAGASHYVERLPASHIERAKELERLGFRDEAISAARDALKMGPKVARHHHFLANLLVKMNRLEEAVSAHRKAIELYSGDIRYRRALGRTLQRLGRLEEAEAELRKVIDVEREDIATLRLLVKVLRKLGRIHEALAFAEEVVEREPDVPVHRRELSELLAKAASTSPRSGRKKASSTCMSPSTEPRSSPLPGSSTRPTTTR